ncbi:hypothetical protein JCM10207_003975 [Rhodosporidiobolus poonsookiae]
MATFDYADLVDDGMLGFNPSPAFQPPPQPQQYPTSSGSPYQSGYSTPTRGRGGRGGFTPRGGRGGGSGSASPASSYGGAGRGKTLGGFGGIGAGAGHQGLGAFGARGRGRGGAPVPGMASPRGGGMAGRGGHNPLLVPVKFVKATTDGLGTVGGDDEHGLEKAGAEAPQPWQVKPFEQQEGDKSVDGGLSDEVKRLQLDGDAPPVSAEPFEPEPATTATMALDEVEDSTAAAEPAAHPGLGSRPHPTASLEPTPAKLVPSQPEESDPPSSAFETAQNSVAESTEDDTPLFEIHTTRSEVALPTSLPPPAAFARSASDTLSEDNSDDSDEDDEKILYSRFRAVAHADPVALSRPPPAAPSSATPAVDLSSPHATAPKPSQQKKAAPLKMSKKALKKAGRIARKTGRLHARSGNAHLVASDDDDELDGAVLGGLDDEAAREAAAQDKDAGRALFARMNAGGMDDMLVASEEDDEDDDDLAAPEAEHADGEPREGDSDLDWGEAGLPPARRSAPLARGKGKRAQQRQQRADQREVDKLERLVAAGATREEVEVSLAIEASLAEEDAQRRRERKARERERAEEDYLRHLDADEEGDDSLAVLSAFAKGVVGGLDADHQRGDDADRRMAEDEEDEDAWGTSEEEDETGSGSGDDSEEYSGSDEELEEEEYERRLALEEEDSEEVDSDVELEMDYSLGDADGRVEHSLSLASTSGSTSFDSSLSSSTDSDAELYAFESSLLSGEKISIQSIGQSGGGGRKAERQRKKDRRRERKGKAKEVAFEEEDSEDSEEDDEDALFTGKDTWAEKDEDFILRMQHTIRMNADLLETAAGGKGARRANRKERNKLFKAISQGDFDDYDGADGGYDDLDDEVERILMEEEDAMGWGAAGSSKKQRKKDKTFNGAFSAELAGRWETDRQKKAKKKAERAAVRAAEREADFRDQAVRFSKNKKGKAAAAAAEQANDAATVNARIRAFIVHDISSTSLSLPPMSKKARIAVHLLAELYGLKSRSLGSGKARFPVLERTSRTSVSNVSERRIRAIVGTADGENELDEGYERWGGMGRGGRPKGGKMLGLWKALEGADGKGKRSSGSGAAGRNSEGAVVGQGADKLGSDNVGFALLKKMGWTEGGQIGLSGGITEPIAARVKTNKQGLGSGFAVSRLQAQRMAAAPERDWDE